VELVGLKLEPDRLWRLLSVPQEVSLAYSLTNTLFLISPQTASDSRRSPDQRLSHDPGASQVGSAGEACPRLSIDDRPYPVPR
jgi:hypothetical protein